MPEPRACPMRVGMRSWSKFSSGVRSHSPLFNESWISAGHPALTGEAAQRCPASRRQRPRKSTHWLGGRRTVAGAGGTRRNAIDKQIAAAIARHPQQIRLQFLVDTEALRIIHECCVGFDLPPLAVNTEPPGAWILRGLPFDDGPAGTVRPRPLSSSKASHRSMHGCPSPTCDQKNRANCPCRILARFPVFPCSDRG